jgi:hypothetical protein
MTLIIMTFSFTTLNLIGVIATLILMALSKVLFESSELVLYPYTECRLAFCRYAECRGATKTRKKLRLFTHSKPG